MVVSVKSGDSYGYSLLPYFGVSESLIAAAMEGGVCIEQSSPGQFTVSKQGHITASIPVKGQAISLAKSGQLGPASKEAWKHQFEQAITKALAVSAPGYTLATEVSAAIAKPVKKYPPKPTVADTAAFMGAGGGVAGLAQAMAQDMAYAVDKEIMSHLKGIGEVSTPHINTAPCPLSKATKCLQPVFGTSSGSIYYVVAMFKGVNLAARIKGHRLSLRVEGEGLKGYAGFLPDLGFTVKDQYGSVHFETGDSGLALKTIGAVVGRMGFSNLLSIVDPLKIMGK